MPRSVLLEPGHRGESENPFHKSLLRLARRRFSSFELFENCSEGEQPASHTCSSVGSGNFLSSD